MARYDQMIERNILSKKEKIIRLISNISLIIVFLDAITLSFHSSRAYHFHSFPNFHIVGIICLFIFTLIRINQAVKGGKVPYMEASREWRNRKGLLGSYDYTGPGPDYSNKLHNIIFFVSLLISFGLMAAEFVNHVNK